MFSVQSFECLGFLVDEKGYRPNPRRLDALVNRPLPTNMSELRSVMGAIQYYARCIPNFADAASNLFDLLNQEEFNWTEAHEKSLKCVFSFLASKAVLRTYSPKELPVIITDASPIGIGAVLEQNGKPVIHISRR